MILIDSYYRNFAGFLVEVISTPVISGFTSASAVIIIISQIKHILGINYKSDSVKDDIVKLFENCHRLKYADTALGVTCIIFLLLLRVSSRTYLLICINRKLAVLISRLILNQERSFSKISTERIPFD